MTTHHARLRPGAIGRVAWTLFSFVAVQLAVCTISALPIVLLWYWALTHLPPAPAIRVAAASALLLPSYLAFALVVLIVAPIAVRAFRWHSPAHLETRLADLDWDLLGWARYCAALHLVRVIAGTWFRGTPLWTLHLRLFGARLGRRVYVNSLNLSDYNLLDFGDDVVIGGAAHVSGHTVEGGVLKTSPIRLGDGVTVGLGSVIEIGVTIAAGAQVGALSFVPKYSMLDAGITYVGAPVVPLGEAPGHHRLPGH